MSTTDSSGSIIRWLTATENKLTSGITKTAGTASQRAIEYTSIKALVGWDQLALLIQTIRTDWGFSPLLPGSGGLYITTASIVIGGTVIASIIIGILLGSFNFLKLGFTGGLQSKKSIIIFSFIVGFVLSYIIYKMFVEDVLVSNDINVAKSFANSLTIIEKFENTLTPTDDTTLLNIQAIAVKQVAYIGPNPTAGSFDVETGVQSALRSGIRFFNFQIGYMEANKTGFDAPLTPTLTYRNESGELISKNGANIGAVAKMLATYAFSPEISNSEKPIIIYLHFQRTPNPLRTPEKYVEFLSNVAKQLEPLYPFIIASMPEGDYNRQKNERGLLKAPLSRFQKKVIYLSNADTAVFRNLSIYGMNNFPSQYDLDFLVSGRVYLENSTDVIGITKPSTGPPPNFVLVPFNRLISLRPDMQDDFALKHKEAFVITMPSQMSNPSKEHIKMALDHLGVNCIPLNLFGESKQTLTEKMKLWGGEALYKLKPAPYRGQAGTEGFTNL